MRLKTTLEQWLTLIEVDRAGSIQAAALALNKSHTTLMYALRKLEQQLGMELICIEQRRAVLTVEARALLRRAVPMVEQARELESVGSQIALGVEPEITLTLDHLCCREWVMAPLGRFFDDFKGTSVQIRETSLSATERAVTERQADLAIITLPVDNHLTDPFGVVTMVPVAGRGHPLAGMKAVTAEDLITHTQIVVRDLGEDDPKRQRDVGWLRSERRITVDNFDHAWDAVRAGVGFCRMPDHRLARLDPYEVVPLTLAGGGSYQVPLHLTLPKGKQTGVAARALYALLRQAARERRLQSQE
ncbi:LysR family transcriptional regulator [Ferrimonas sediminicola]|uniref:LysR family transcriptional regulator n=1 Tax=Ferrimonas sediminicola TaxID=2569538 RepID=A0A4U1BCF2_9GAMM|nr:LysR family transcriptional regulator [Ferrimonas sediminicola]TKB48693.1 LysR family transcriptional regulator [Ferrimonas sediminicola]